MADVELMEAKEAIKKAMSKISSTSPKANDIKDYKKELISEIEAIGRQIDVLIEYDKGYDKCYDGEKEGKEMEDCGCDFHI